MWREGETKGRGGREGRGQTETVDTGREGKPWPVCLVAHVPKADYPEDRECHIMNDPPPISEPPAASLTRRTERTLSWLTGIKADDSRLTTAVGCVSDYLFVPFDSVEKVMGETKKNEERGIVQTAGPVPNFWPMGHG